MQFKQKEGRKLKLTSVRKQEEEDAVQAEGRNEAYECEEAEAQEEEVAVQAEGRKEAEAEAQEEAEEGITMVELFVETIEPRSGTLMKE